MPRPRKQPPNRKDGLYEVKITLGRRLDGSLVRKSFYSSISKDDAANKPNATASNRPLPSRPALPSSTVPQNSAIGPKPG